MGRITLGAVDDRQPEGGRAVPTINLNFGLCIGNSGSRDTPATRFVGKGTQIPQRGGKGGGWRFSQCCGTLGNAAAPWLGWGNTRAAEPEPAPCRGVLCFHMPLPLKSSPCTALR